VDAAILIAAARGRSSDALRAVTKRALLVTTDRALQEARRRLVLGMNRPDLGEVISLLAGEMTVVPVAALTMLLRPAELALQAAVASRNGSTRDAHMLALAWAAEADIWTTDRDFAGTGIATWSTPNLLRALFLEGAKA
jgi:predicted nucleic acid-binding protein